jgi:hypothetical protein
VDPPTFDDRQFGLLSVVQARYEEPDPHWRNGVTVQTICGLTGTTFDDYCVTGAAPAKADNVDTPVRGAQPFTVFGEVDCSPIGYEQSFERARAVDALTRSEGFQVERVFWTGTAGGTANKVYPHLAADTTVLDAGVLPTITLQCAATAVTGAALLDVVEAFGYLEASLGSCYNGRGVLHVPLILGEQLFRAGIVKPDGAILKTQTGNLVALGAGYTGSGPDGTSIANSVWVYITPPVFAYRSGIETFRFVEQFDRAENTLKTIVERTYLLGFDCCCLYAVRVSTGGIVTGQPLSPF